jgi:tetratricopeptide (TPR) repeat protein
LALAEAAQRSDLVAAATIYLGMDKANDGNLEEAVSLYERAIAQGGNAYAYAYDNLGRTFYWLGRYPEAVAHLRKAIELQQGDPIGQIFPLQDLGMALAATGEYSEAVRAFGQARHLSREHEVWPLLARSVATSAGFHLDVFDYAGNQTLAEEARAIARAADYVGAEVSASLDLLFNFARRREVGWADKLLDEVAEPVEKAYGSHAWMWRLRLAQARAELALAREEIDEALDLAGIALQDARDFGRVKYQVLALKTRGQALAARGSTAAALGDLRSAVDIARATSDPALFFQAAASLLTVEGDDTLAQEAHAAAERIRTALPTEEMRQSFEAAEPVRHVARLMV